MVVSGLGGLGFGMNDRVSNELYELNKRLLGNR